jgi:hypothetical protein
MCVRIKICSDGQGTWTVHVPSPVPAPHFASLSATIDYAREACNAAPATIELFVDGMYIVAHQERGWPKALVASGIGRRPIPAEPDPGRAALWSRLVARLRGPQHRMPKPALPA